VLIAIIVEGKESERCVAVARADARGLGRSSHIERPW
jgi:hypothetical protein